MQPLSTNLQKYQSANPVVRHLIYRFLRKLIKEVSDQQPQTMIELGCGEGVIAQVLLREVRKVAYVGYDRSATAIEEAHRRNPGVPFRQADILDLRPTDQVPDVILCIEVMEHIQDSERLLSRIAILHGHVSIISVPWEPFFRIGNLCRGRHLARLGNHPEHVHCFTKCSLASVLKRHFVSVRIVTSFPWLLGICQNPIG